MKLEGHALLDALCGEYLVGTLRGAARRRFERALREEPRIGLRLRHWQHMTPRDSTRIEVRPPASLWSRLEGELRLARYRLPWYRGRDFWLSLAALAASVVLVVAFIFQISEPAQGLVQIAELSATDQSTHVTAHRSADGRMLVLHASPTMVAGTDRSYELWLIPAEGGQPVSLAVLGALDAHFTIAESERQRLRDGATLAVSVEPSGGSPTGKPSGPVIVTGRISL
jgi:anti-sigma-K factor RskA